MESRVTLFNEKLDSEEPVSKRNLNKELQEPLPLKECARRKGPGSSYLTYIESWKVVDLANEFFGYNGWSCTLDELHVVYDYQENGKWHSSARARVTVKLNDGSSHTDIGFGKSQNARHRGDGLEKAQKQAVTDARKRALRLFGNRLGNCLYDKEFVKKQRINEKPSASTVSPVYSATKVKPMNTPKPRQPIPSYGSTISPIYSATKMKPMNTPRPRQPLPQACQEVPRPAMKPRVPPKSTVKMPPREYKYNDTVSAYYAKQAK